MERNNKGGAKPDMLSGGNPLTIIINGKDRKDWYETSKDKKSVARRVELPTWLSEQTRQLKSERKSLHGELSLNNIRHPKEEIGEGHGHILIEAVKHTGQEIPCVGIDTEIIKQLEPNPPDSIYFVVYYVGYQPCERWFISWKDFIENGIEVKAEKGFMPQKMIPVTYLKFVGR